MPANIVQVYRVAAFVAWCGLLLAPPVVAADKYDFSKFDAGELFLVKSALGILEAHDGCYAYLTSDQRNQDVMRMSNKYLSRPNGKHPEAQPPAADLFLQVEERGKSSEVMKFLKPALLSTISACATISGIMPAQ